MNTRNTGILGLVLIISIFVLPRVSQANDLVVTNVRLGPRDTAAKTLAVFFDISWKNSWRNKINHDAAWVTVRLQDDTSAEKKLCLMTAAGLNPSGAVRGSSTDLEIFAPSDKTGVFFRRATNHPAADVATTSAMLTVNYDACGFTATSNVSATVNAVEMVLIPKGAFFAGDNGFSTAAFRRGAADNSPWPLTSESAVNVTGASSGGNYYVSAANPGESATGSSFIIPVSFPKGYNAFYLMKYELTEGQWVEFVNALPAVARSHRDVTDAAHKNSDAVVARNTLACSGSPLVCGSANPQRAMTFLSWPDICAFLDWAGLRPVTELEFEKAARGPFLPLNGEYAWGNTNIIAADALSGVSEDGTEAVTTLGANARYNSVTLSGGNAGQGPEHQQGPLRAGIFSTTTSDRTASGAGNYGVLDLSGNAKEWIVSVGNASALPFSGVHGDGYLTAVAGAEGNANTAAWPGIDADPTHGVTSAAGAGFRGGSWADPSSRLAVSDRSEAASGASGAASTYGGRGARSAEDQ